MYRFTVNLRHFYSFWIVVTGLFLYDCTILSA